MASRLSLLARRPLTRSGALVGSTSVRVFSAPQASRTLSTDGRNRLSNFWIPSGGLAETESGGVHELLQRAGFVRGAHAGIFHLLPLGNRVITKLERLIDHHMERIGACKLQLATLSSEKIWEQSGRLEKAGQELFKLKDRKGSKLLLSPTNEEEITNLIANNVQSHNQLPLRLYQITRKYRDERRPRAGLLRGREFLMKDLYTFDSTPEAAKGTYAEVYTAYSRIFEDLNIPFAVADADSGDMGGTLSHEFLYYSATGEDSIANCKSCGYSANLECAKTKPDVHEDLLPEDITVYAGISLDRKTLIQAFYPKQVNGQPTEVNVAYLRHLVPELDSTLSTSPAPLFEQNFSPPNSDHPSTVINIFDSRIPTAISESASSFSAHTTLPTFVHTKTVPSTSLTPPPGGFHLTKLQSGDPCHKCDSPLTVSTGVEIAHTFYLGQRYTVPFEAKIMSDKNEKNFIEMGCYGIGVSRLLAATAAALADKNGLNWPVKIAPFEVCVITNKKTEDGSGEKVYDILADSRFDTILDDRPKQLGWKLKDADMVGYPVDVVIGRNWPEGQVEVRNRMSGGSVLATLEELPVAVGNILKTRMIQ